MNWTKPYVDFERKLLTGVQIVYNTDYYDGPISGHAWYEGRYCYFKIASFDNDDDDTDETRLYSLYDMSKLETMIQLSDRCLFQDIVGTHNTYGLEGNVPCGLHSKDYFDKTKMQKLRIRMGDKKDPHDTNLFFIGHFI